MDTNTNKQKLLIASLNCVGALCARDAKNMRSALLKLPNATRLSKEMNFEINGESYNSETMVINSKGLKNYIEHAVKEVVDNDNDVVMTIYSHIKPVSMGLYVKDNEDCFVTNDGSIFSETALMRYLRPLKKATTGSLTLIVIGCYAESMFDSFTEAPCTVYVSADKDEVTTAGRFTDAFVDIVDNSFNPDNKQPFAKQLSIVMNALFSRAHTEQWYQHAMLLDKLYYNCDINVCSKNKGIVPMNEKIITNEQNTDLMKKIKGLMSILGKEEIPVSAVHETKVIGKPYIDIKYRDCLGNEGKITCTPVTLRIMEAAIESLFEVFGTTIMVNGEEVNFEQFKIVDSGLKGAA